MNDIDIMYAYSRLGKGEPAAIPVSPEHRAMILDSYLKLEELSETMFNETNMKCSLGYDCACAHWLLHKDHGDVSITAVYRPASGIALYLLCWGSVKPDAEAAADIVDGMGRLYGEAAETGFDASLCESYEDRGRQYSYEAEIILRGRTEAPAWEELLSAAESAFGIIREHTDPDAVSDGMARMTDAPPEYIRDIWEMDDEYISVQCTAQAPRERDPEFFGIRRYEDQYFFKRACLEECMFSEEACAAEFAGIITWDRSPNSFMDKWVVFYSATEIQQKWGMTSPAAFISPYVKGYIYIHEDYLDFWGSILEKFHIQYLYQADEEYRRDGAGAKEAFDAFMAGRPFADVAFCGSCEKLPGFGTGTNEVHEDDGDLPDPFRANEDDIPF